MRSNLANSRSRSSATGNLTIPTRFLASNVSEADIKAWLGTTAAMVTPPTNVTLVRTPSETILIDVGAGAHFMPGAGKLAENMEAAGIDRKAVTKVVFTHAHPDHIWGTLDDFDDEPMFPSASYLISAAEWNFWMADDVASKLPEDRQNFAPGAKRNLNKIKEKLRTIRSWGGHRHRHPSHRYLRAYPGSSLHRDRLRPRRHNCAR